MKKSLFLLTLTLPLFATNLITLIESAQKNELVDAYKAKIEATTETYEAAKSSYLPRVDIGAVANLTSPADAMGAGQIYSAYAQASVVLLDGFKRENILDEMSKLKSASKYDLSQIKKDISLQVTTLYFNMQIVQAEITSLLQSKKQLQEQLKQQQKFFEAKLTTEDNVARIEAAIANIEYQSEVKKYQYDEFKALLHTLSNTQIDTITKHSISEPKILETQELDNIKSLQAQADAIGYKAQQIDSSSYPSIVLSDKYSYTQFEDDNLNPAFAERINSQNVLSLNISMNLIDFGVASSQKQAVLSEKNALLSNLAYKRKELDADIKLSLRAIERSKKLLYASELSQNAFNRTFEIVEKKYKARVVDYVKYLDALSNKTESDAQYNRALGTLQISYAQYYYYAGLDIKEYIK